MIASRLSLVMFVLQSKGIVTNLWVTFLKEYRSFYWDRQDLSCADSFPYYRSVISEQGGTPAPGHKAIYKPNPGPHCNHMLCLINSSCKSSIRSQNWIGGAPFQPACSQRLVRCLILYWSNDWVNDNFELGQGITAQVFRWVLILLNQRCLHSGDSWTTTPIPKRRHNGDTGNPLEPIDSKSMS